MHRDGEGLFTTHPQHASITGIQEIGLGGGQVADHSRQRQQLLQEAVPTRYVSRADEHNITGAH
jgi:hypothetical protein